MRDYSHFIFEYLETSGKVPFEMSPRLSTLLLDIDHPISRELRRLAEERDGCVVSYLDLDDSSIDGITYLDAIRVPEGNPYADRRRAATRVGRLVHRIFGDRYPTGGARHSVEVFANTLKSLREMAVGHGTFRILSGPTIVEVYRSDLYPVANGSINHSCMNDKLEFLSLYTDNPGVVRLLALFGPDGKVYGRALVWNLTTLDGKPTDRVYMDRIYTARYHDDRKFVTYADRKDWLYRSDSGPGLDFEVYDPEDGTQRWRKIEVSIKPGDYSPYPYVDSLQVYDRTNSILTNDGDRMAESECYSLSNTEGELGLGEDWVWSETEGRRILMDNAAYTIIGEDNGVVKRDFVLVDRLDLVKLRGATGRVTDYVLVSAINLRPVREYITSARLIIDKQSKL